MSKTHVNNRPVKTGKSKSPGKSNPPRKSANKPKALKLNKGALINVNKSKNLTLESLLSGVENFLNHEIYFNPDSKVLLAVSGGVDSVTLLDVFANLTFKFPSMQIGIAHFNHNLRAESSDCDEDFVMKLAKRYNVQFFSAKGNVKQYSEQKGISIEQAARILRYKFLERSAKKFNADYVATAHTADDSAETFFINLIRGAGITGLSGIPVRRILIKRISLIRPLLFLRKIELTEYARLRKLKWREDESNKMLFYTRNKVRHDLIPQLEENYSPAIIPIINRTQKLLQGADALITKHVQKAIQSLICNKASGKFSIKLPVFQTFDDFTKGEIIQKSISNNFFIPHLSMQAIDRIIELEDKPVGSICEINKNYFVLRDRDLITFIKKETVNKLHMIIEKEGEFVAVNRKLILTKVTKRQVKFGEDSNVEFLDYDLVPSRLYLKNWEQGDSFIPLGMNGNMKVSDFLTNNKLSLYDKKDIIILSTKSDIIWICGMRLSDKFKVTENTTKYLKAEFVTK